MDINRRRLWMDNRNFPGRRGLQPSFVAGVKEFLDLVRTTDNYLRHGKIRCPCEKCKCVKTQDLTNVEVHLYKKGFMPNYYVWYNHGEPWDLQEHLQLLESIHGGRSSPVVEPDLNNYRMEDMVHDVFGMYPDNDPLQPGTSHPNIDVLSGGSVSAATQKMRLEKKEKRTILIPEMHKIRHIKSDKKGGEVKVEPRANEAWERATKAIEEWTSTQQSECGSNTPAPLTVEQETNLWLEVNGGVKKGSAYGLATLYSSDKHKSNYLGSSAFAPSSFADPGEMARMKEEIAELKRQNEAILKANEAMRMTNEAMRIANEAMRIANETQQKETQELLKKLLAKKKKKKSKEKHKSRRRHSSSSESEAESSSGSSH